MALFHHPASAASPPPPGPGGQPHRRARFELPAQQSSVSVARRLLAESLRRWRCPEQVVDTAQLVLSEFITNAVVHTVSDRIVCSLQEHRGRGRLRVEVCDQGDEPLGLAPRTTGPEATSGRGLQLVDALADSWGDIRTAPGRGRVVWAELVLEA